MTTTIFMENGGRVDHSRGVVLFDRRNSSGVYELWRRMARKLISAAALLTFCTAALAQYRYSYYKESSLSGAAGVVTVQPKTNTARRILFDGVYVYCSVACTFTLEKGGSAATGTAGTVTLLNTSVATVANVYHTSDVGVGTTVAKYSLVAEEGLSLDLSAVVLPGGTGSARNLSIRTNSITGTVRVLFLWRESP